MGEDGTGAGHVVFGHEQGSARGGLPGDDSVNGGFEGGDVALQVRGDGGGGEFGGAGDELAELGGVAGQVLVRGGGPGGVVGGDAGGVVDEEADMGSPQLQELGLRRGAVDAADRGAERVGVVGQCADRALDLGGGEASYGPTPTPCKAARKLVVPAASNRTVISGESRSPTDTPRRRLSAAGRVVRHAIFARRGSGCESPSFIWKMSWSRSPIMARVLSRAI